MDEPVLTRKKRILFGCITAIIPITFVVLLIVGYEYYLWNFSTSWIVPYRSVPEIRWNEHSQPHPVLGVQLKSDWQGKFTHYFIEEKFETTVTLDADRKRHTLVVGPPRDKFFALFGCSMAFGSSVDDLETIPFWIGQKFPQWHPYNFGVPGMATPHMLARIQEGGLKDSIAQQSGIAVYLYFDFQISRIIGGQRDIKTWDILRPAYDVVDGELVYLGDMRQGHPWRMWWYDFTWEHSRIVRRHLNMPLGARYSYHDAEVVAATIRESARLFLQQYPDSEFVLAVYREPDGPPGYRVDDIMALVEASGIRVIDLWNASLGTPFSCDTWRWHVDGHMRPETTQKAADLLGYTLDLAD